MSASQRTANRTRLWVVAASLALLAASSCTDTSTGPDFGANDPNVILAIGDSITFGLMDTNIEYCEEEYRAEGGYCRPLAWMVNKTVVNAGTCGALSEYGVEHIGEELARWRPGVVLIYFGANDLIFDDRNTIGNLRMMVAIARANNTIPVLATLIPSGGPMIGLQSGINRLNSEILALCAEEKLECADHYQAFLYNSDYANTLLSEEGLHPNHAGYQVMAETWHATLSRVY